MGAIQVGDRVFDETGAQCRVTAAYEPTLPERAYRITFSDGSTIEAGGEHQWITWSHTERKAWLRSGRHENEDGPKKVYLPKNWPRWRVKHRWGNVSEVGPQIRTTDCLAETLRYGKRGDTNHSIPVAGWLDVEPNAPLPIPPYTLGLWLGDGDTESAGIGATRQSEGIESLTGRLKKLGLTSGKYVPPAYLRGTSSQRLALLQGLMDTDGYADAKKNTVEFCNTNQNIAYAVLELARSLGQKPSIKAGRAMLYGRDCGPKWRVTWRPTIDVFRLKRKAVRIKPVKVQGFRHRHRMIRSIERIPVKPMRCIAVDSPNSLFLAGEAMIPTHNSTAASLFLLGLPPGTPAMVVAPTAHMLHTSTLKTFLQLTQEAGVLAPGGWRPSEGKATLVNGTEVLFRSAGVGDEDPNRLRGANLGAFVLDEAREMPELVWTILLGSLRREPGIGVVLSTPRWDHWMRPKFANPAEDSDYGVVFASTRGNEFLPAWFIPTIEADWTGEYQRQEIDGLFVQLGGSLFQRAWFPISGAAPSGLRWVRFWDLAVTTKTRSDESASVRVALDEKGRMLITGGISFKAEWPDAEKRILETARADPPGTVLGVEEAGISLPAIQDLRRRPELLNVRLVGVPVTRDKVSRAQVWAARAEAGRILVCDESGSEGGSGWVKRMLDQVECFPGGSHDDWIDCISGAVELLGRHSPGDLGISFSTNVRRFPGRAA